MKYKNFLIRLFDLILVLGLLAGYQAVIYSRDKEATIAELKSQVNQLQGEKEDILEAAKNSGKLGTDGVSAGQTGTYKDGTYTGSSQGFGGEIKVKVTVSGKKISAIDIIEAGGEDEAYLSMAEDIVKTILDKQTTEVDTISGATYSSTGIKNAVGQALEGAAKYEEKEKNIGADNHRSDDTGSIFYYLSSVIFHCIYRNKINCRTNYTACKSAVEFLCTDACCIAGLYHCVWTIFLWFCLCIWNMGGFRLFYFIYDSQKKKKETVEMFFKSGKDTPVFKICCTACCPASLYKRLQ